MRRLVLPAVLGLLWPLTGPASAAPSCVVLNWRNNDTCWFDVPAGAYQFGGVALAAEDGPAWVAVEIRFQGVVVDSCYGVDNGTGVATCQDWGQPFATSLAFECHVFGTGGPKFHCADPPALPLP